MKPDFPCFILFGAINRRLRLPGAEFLQNVSALLIFMTNTSIEKK